MSSASPNVKSKQAEGILGGNASFSSYEQVFAFLMFLNSHFFPFISGVLSPGASSQGRACAIQSPFTHSLHVICPHTALFFFFFFLLFPEKVPKPRYNLTEAADGADAFDEDFQFEVVDITALMASGKPFRGCCTVAAETSLWFRDACSCLRVIVLTCAL